VKLLALGGSAIFVLACILTPQGLLDTSLYSDVHVYSLYAHRMLAGELPYRDFYDEYPPLAQPLLLAARSVLLFKLVLAACGIGIVALLALVFRSTVAVAVFAVSPLLVGSIYLNAYDLWPAFLLAAALALFARQRPLWAFAVLGAATAAKIYPVAVLPIALLFVARYERVRGLVVFVGVLVVTHLPFAILGPGGLRFSYTTQARRGLELNSLGGSVLMALRHQTLANEPPGSLNVTGGTARAVAAISAALVVLAIAAATYLYARGRLSFLVACAAAVAGFVAFDKVFSAQYVEWLAPLAPLGGVVAAGVTVVLLVLTHAVFSHRDAIAEQRELGYLLARNLVAVGLFGVLMVRPGAGGRGGTPRLRRGPAKSRVARRTTTRRRS
jgi:Glycosyltransferase family 87